MNSKTESDGISSLDDVLLVLIISNLSVKDAVKTSALSPRWRDLYLKTSTIAFIEQEFVKLSVSHDEISRRDARVSFVQFMVTWVSRFSGETLESLQICLSKPSGFEAEIRSVIEFAVSRGVKSLVLDFSDPSWASSYEAKEEATMFQLPECVYQSADTVSLKLFFCGFNVSRFANPCPLRSLRFGWIQLRNIMDLLSKCPFLECLAMSNCWDVGLHAITEKHNRLVELIYDNCELAGVFSTLDLPNIRVFKYSGKVHKFYFLAVNRNMMEAELDFGAETEYGEMTGTLLAGLLYDLLSAKKLTVCPYLIQRIHECDEAVKIQASMETKHLVMKTSMQPSEFAGIRLMINSCPELKRLTFVMGPPRSVMPTTAGGYEAIYWTLPIVHACMEDTLRVVEVKNFRGIFYEVHVIRYLIRYCLRLQRLELYVPVGLDSSISTFSRSALTILRRDRNRGSNRLRIFTHDA